MPRARGHRSTASAARRSRARILAALRLELYRSFYPWVPGSTDPGVRSVILQILSLLSEGRSEEQVWSIVDPLPLEELSD